MNKKTENHRHAVDNVGSFDAEIKKANITGNDFTFEYPYGIVGIKSDPDSVLKFVDLLTKFGLGSNVDESIMDCHVDREELEKGEKVRWLAPRYGMKQDHITFGQWLQEEGLIEEPGKIVQFRKKSAEVSRGAIRGIVEDEGTGTYGG